MQVWQQICRTQCEDANAEFCRQEGTCPEKLTQAYHHNQLEWYDGPKTCCLACRCIHGVSTTQTGCALRLYAVQAGMQNVLSHQTHIGQARDTDSFSFHLSRACSKVAKESRLR